MYSRNRFRDSDEPYRIPENYRGNAFGGIHEVDESKPQPPPSDPLPLPENEEVLPEEKKSFPLASLLPPKPKGLEGGLLGNIGSEELLLLGLFLLLAQNEADDDILLLLLLLLFYK